jgi:hypothetical protein
MLLGDSRWPSLRVDQEAVVARSTQGLELMKAGWSDVPRVRFDGRFWQLDDLPILPSRCSVRVHRCGRSSAPRALAWRRHGDALLGGTVKLM